MKTIQIYYFLSKPISNVHFVFVIIFFSKIIIVFFLNKCKSVLRWYFPLDFFAVASWEQILNFKLSDIRLLEDRHVSMSHINNSMKALDYYFVDRLNDGSCFDNIRKNSHNSRYSILQYAANLWNYSFGPQEQLSWSIRYEKLSNNNYITG